jgi:hypothetical protein
MPFRVLDLANCGRQLIFIWFKISIKSKSTYKTLYLFKNAKDMKKKTGKLNNKLTLSKMTIAKLGQSKSEKF